VSTSIDLPLANESKRVLAYAAEEAERLGDKHIGTEHLFLGLLREEKCFAAQILRERGISLESAREQVRQQQRDTPIPEPRKQAGLLGEFSAYASDLTTQTQPLVGRKNEFDRLIEILSLYSRKNPVLVGEAGVGKRTIVGELARRIADGVAPRALVEKHILALDLPPLRVLDKDRSWQERLDHVLVRAAERGAILFLNEAHDLPGGAFPVSSMHVTEVLQRPLVAGKIQCISTATPANYAKLIANAHWLARHFEPVHVAPASEDEAIKVLERIKGTYEQFHNVVYTEDALTDAVRYASIFINSGALPGKALDVIDEAGASVQVQRGKLPEEAAEVRKRIRFIAQRMEAAIANHEFEKARFYSNEEKKERDNLAQLNEKYKLDENVALVVRPEDIESAVSKISGVPVATIHQSRSAGSPGSREDPAQS
jgi:ATP-dependent Clp protease ATP-binding subunit ClpC